MDVFEQELYALGFRVTGASRRGGRAWSMGYGEHLTFVVHDHVDPERGRVLVTWRFALGPYLEGRGWQTTITDETALELFPSADVLVARDLEAVGAELARVLGTLPFGADAEG